MYKKKSGCIDQCLVGFVIVCLLGMFVVWPIGSFVYSTTTYDTVVITVENKDVSVSQGTSTYLIFSDSGEVFQTRDSFWNWKFNSSDTYGAMKKGKTYEAKVFGRRIPFFSMYRSVLTATEVK